MGDTTGDGSTNNATARTVEATPDKADIASNAGAAGMLVPFHIEPGCTVLEIGAGNGALTQALAEHGAQVHALEADADLAQQAGQRSVGLALAQVEHTTLATWLESTDITKRGYDIVLFRQHDVSSVEGTADLELVVGAATRLLRPSGTLLLGVHNRWGLRTMLGSDAGDSGRGRAGLRTLLDGGGFSEQRWLLPYPDLRAPEVIVDTELFDQPIGANLTELFVRRPLAAPGSGDLFVTDPLEAFQSAVHAGLAADIADTFLVAATRGRKADAVTREGRMWVVPSERMSAAWQRPNELLEINGRWLIHPVGSYEGMESGPLRLTPVTITAPVGKSGEDVLVEALIGPGPFAAVTQGLLRTWWSAVQIVIAQSEPGHHQLDLRPCNFAVNESGEWTFISQPLTFHFQVPRQVLGLAAMAHTIVKALMPRGWMPGLEPSMTVADAARFLLDKIEVPCGDEHVLLWRVLEADIRVRVGGPDIDHERARQAAHEFSETTIGSILDRLPLAARFQAGVAATRLAAEAESRRSEIAELRTARDEAAVAKLRAELESNRLRREITRLEEEPYSARNSLGRDDEAADLEAISSVEDYETARSRSQPWVSAGGLVCAREHIETNGRLEHIRADSRYALVLAPPDHVIKFYGPWEQGHGVYAMETQALRLLERDPTLPVTRLVAGGDLSENWRYVVLTRIHGVRLHDVRARLGQTALAEAAAWMGRFARQIRAVPLEDAEREAGWTRFEAQVARLHRDAEATLAERQVLPRHLVDQVGAWLPSVSELASSPERAVLTHGDLTLKHVLGEVVGHRFQPAGVIDLNDSFIGAGMYDLARLWWSFGGDLRPMRAFLAEADLGRPEDPVFRRLALAWLLLRPRTERPVSSSIKSVATLDELAARVFGPDDE